MSERVRITVDGELLHEGPRSWSSDGLEPPPPEPTEYDRLPPYGEVVDFAGFRVLWVSHTLKDRIEDARLSMHEIKIDLFGTMLRRPVV